MEETKNEEEEMKRMKLIINKPGSMAAIKIQIHSRYLMPTE